MNFCTRNKIAVMIYLPHYPNDYYLIQFVTFVYSSWLFVTENSADYVTFPNCSSIDLVVLCDPPSCSRIPKNCTEFSANVSQFSQWEPKCLFHAEHAIKHPYEKMLNSFAFVKDEHLRGTILSRYDHLLRTDIDVFLSPALLDWIPKGRIATGQGGYCTEFNRNRLEQVAARLGIRHQKVHCAGSTWFGETSLILKLSNATLWLAAHFYDSEFNSTVYPEIKVYMNKSVEGQWPEWWRPVSLLYGQELALNYLIDNLNEKTLITRDFLDVESCRKTSILQHPHVHCWHADCEFNKFKFIDFLLKAIQTEKNLRVPFKFVQPMKNVQNFSVSEYCTNVAWNGFYRFANYFAQLYSGNLQDKKS